MATYYVSTTGNDSNPGTFAQPKLNIMGATGGMSLLSAGDTLDIRAGTYSEQITSYGTPTLVTGTIGNPITIQGHAGETVQIGKVDFSLNANLSYYVFDNLIISGGNDTGFYMGESNDHVTLKNSEVKLSVCHGIAGAAEFLLVQDSLVHDNGSSCPPAFLHVGGVGYGFYWTGPDAIFERCEVYANKGYGFHIYDAGSNLVARATVRNCRVHDNSGPEFSAGILLASGSGHQAYNNLVYGNVGGIQTAACDDCKIYNNTIYNNSDFGIQVNDTVNLIIKNNILRLNGDNGISDLANSTGLISSFNFCDSAGSGCLLTGDPLFLDPGSDDFHLQIGSPAIDAGTDLTTEGITTDFDYHFRPQGPAFDIGAHESFFSAEDPSNIFITKSDSPIVSENLGKTLNPQGNLQISVADFPVASDRTVNPSGIDDLDTLVPGGSAQSGNFVPAENPKTYTLRVVDARIGANGIIEWDLVRGDVYPYDAFANPESPLLGAFIGGGSPPPTPIEDDQSDQSKPGAARLMLLDIPLLLPQHDGPGFYAAAGGINPAYAGAFLYEKKGDDFIQIAELGTRATMGSATELSSGPVTTFDISGRTFVFDDANTVDVTLIDAVTSLSSTSDTNLLGGANACAIGQPGRWEILEFGVATQIDTQKWTLSHLLRGLKGTEWAIGLHTNGDQFVLLNTALRRVTDSITDLNVARIFRAVSIGTDLDSARNRNFTDTGVSQKPLSPVFLRGTEDVDGNRVLIWNRRSRVDGLAGLDTYDPPPPLGETIEKYEIDILDAPETTVLRTLTVLHETAPYSAAQQTADFGSVPSELHFCVYQISETIGRGYAGCGIVDVFDATPIDVDALVVESLAVVGEVQLHGDITLSQDDGVVLTQVGQNIAIGVTTVDDAIEFVIDGVGGVITTGIKGDLEIPYDCIIERATLLADQTGSIVIDVWKDSFALAAPTDADSITASAPPTISSATKSQDFTLTGWTTIIEAGSILRFNVDSATTITRVTLSLKVRRTLLGGGGVRVISISDSPTVTDSKTILLGTRIINVFDAPTATESVAVMYSLRTINISDAPTVTESKTIILV